MKNILSLGLVVLFLGATACSYGQDDKSKRKSPPAETTGMVGKAKITINYSQPSVNDREIWGGLVPYGEIWRTGANEATTIEVSEAIKVEGVELSAGKYALFTIPGKSEWTIVINKVWEQWGAYKYDATQDALRVKVKSKSRKEKMEKLTISLNGQKGNQVMTISWDKLDIPVKLSK